MLAKLWASVEEYMYYATYMCYRRGVVVNRFKLSVCDTDTHQPKPQLTVFVVISYHNIFKACVSGMLI